MLATLISLATHLAEGVKVYDIGILNVDGPVRQAILCTEEECQLRKSRLWCLTLLTNSATPTRQNYGSKGNVPGDLNAGIKTYDFPVLYGRAEGLSFDACKLGPNLTTTGGWVFPPGVITVPAGATPADHVSAISSGPISVALSSLLIASDHLHAQ